jgi:hypothetical protein
MTPFLVVNDGSGTTLNFITFKFTYRGDDIVDIDWEADCTTVPGLIDEV